MTHDGKDGDGVSVDHPETPWIWVKDLHRDEVASTCFSNPSESYWTGRVEVVENSNNGRDYRSGQVLVVKVGGGLPWFHRPQQYETDKCSMFVQPCHVISIEGDAHPAGEPE